MSFVVLPVLPDKMIGPYHLFNPYKTWLMAVIIAAISFVGYAAIKLLGQKRGVFITGAAGGLISSTAVSISLSKMFNRQFEYINNYTGGIAIACTFMYLRVLFEAAVVHPELALRLAPAYLAAASSGLLFSWWLYSHSKAADINFENPAISRNPLQLSEAIKFGLLFGIIYGAIAFADCIHEWNRHSLCDEFDREAGNRLLARGLEAWMARNAVFHSDTRVDGGGTVRRPKVDVAIFRIVADALF